jgi:glycosyltransferase involved in cell wall biosynthesis
MTFVQPRSNLPLVSVIIPAYNAEAFIERTLNSVCSQTYQNLEVLVVDDGSSDRTSDIVQQVAAADSRVQLLRQANSGVAAARNLAIQSASGELIAPIDADDLWYPSNLEKQVACLQTASPPVGVVYSWSVDITESDALTGEFHASSIEGNVYTSLLCHNFLGNASASLIRKACLDQVGGYDRTFREQNAQGCEDWDLYLRLAEQYEFRVIPEFLVGYRKIQHSMSRDYTTMAKSHALMLQTARQQHPEVPTAFFRLSCSSFYLYLARQCSQNGNDRGALLWIGRALQAECFTPLLRLGVYSMALKSGVGQFAEHTLPAGLHQLLSVRRAQPSPLKTLADLEQQTVSIRFKLAIGSLFHRLMRFISQVGLEKHRSSNFPKEIAAGGSVLSPLSLPRAQR